MASGVIIQSPPGPIPPYPPETPTPITYPFEWTDPAYGNRAQFHIELSGVSASATATYKWAVVANPGNWRYRLRSDGPFPPGEILYTELFTEHDAVWLPFLSRRELDTGMSRHDFTTFEIECEVRIEDGGSTETITVRQPLDLVQTQLAPDHMFLDEKLERALTLSIPYWPASVGASAAEFFTNPTALAFMAGSTVVLMAVALAPHPLAKGVGIAFAGALTVAFGVQTVETLFSALKQLTEDCRGSRNDAQLEQAGKRFAEACGEPVFNLLLSLVLWRVGSALGNIANQARRARVAVTAQLAADAAAHSPPPPPPPADWVTLVSTATTIVRRMGIEEFAKITTGLGNMFKSGRKKRGTVVFSLEEPFWFTREHIKKFLDYFIVHEIEITQEMRELMLLAIPDNYPGGMPDALKHLPRWKFEEGQLTLHIPKALWTEFSVMYQNIRVLILPVDASEATQDAETFLLQ